MSNIKALKTICIILISSRRVRTQNIINENSGPTRETAERSATHLGAFSSFINDEVVNIFCNLQTRKKEESFVSAGRKLRDVNYLHI